MAVTITKDEVGKTTLEFVRDVLRYNLTDVQSPARDGSEWIFDSHEDEIYVRSNLPRVYIEETEELMEKLAPNVKGPVYITLNIEVWVSGSSARENRNSIADEIGKILSNKDSSDGTTTMRGNNLGFGSMTKSNEDMVLDDVLLRIKRLTIKLRYFGS